MTTSTGADVILTTAESLGRQHAPEIETVGGMPAPRKIQPGARGSFGTVHDEGAGRLDVVAGSEFLDDRIRLRE